jgi:putative ABC transport system permease protein
VVEVTLALVLLIGSGLLIRGFMKLTTVDLGFEPEKILFARLPFPKGQYETAQKKQQFFRELLPRLQNLPGVTAVTHAATVPPFGGIRSEVDIPGRARTQERLDSIIELVSEGYFSTLNLRLLRGRLLNEVEMADARKVIVVNQTFATKYFANDDPVGRSVRFKVFEPPGSRHIVDPDFEIIGVVADLKNSGIENSTVPQAYTPLGITGAFERGVLLRTNGNPLVLVNSVRREIWAVDRNIAITDTDSIGNFLRQFSYASPRFSLIVMSVFAGVGLVLVVLGVYSVIAYTVTQQTHEIGIRMALGATRPDVLRMVMRMGGRMIALGSVVGTLASINLTNLLSQQLGGKEWTNDPATIAIVVAFVVVAGLAACYFPALRATRVDPMVALRHE